MDSIFPAPVINVCKSLFIFKKERNVIIDPFSCIVKLCLLNIKPPGTKISIYENKICFNEPGYMQGVTRFLYGDGREDLRNLLTPINKFVNWHWDSDNKDMIDIFNKAASGLEMLKRAYSKNAIIQIAIDYYILVLQRKNPVKVTNFNDDLKCDYDDDHNIRMSLDKETEERRVAANNDIQKFLKDLWNKREVTVIINLLKELFDKTDLDEQQNICENIMGYCHIKEVKLFKYIEEHSSFI